MTRRTPVALGAALLALTATASAATAPTITEHSSGLAVGSAALAVAPVIGRLAGVEPVSGTILVKRPSSRTFAALKGNRTVPIGTVVEASQGVLRLVTALDTHGRTQSATLWGGAFQIGQSRTGNGMTRLVLRGALPTCARGARAHTSSANKRSVKSRKLWARDEHGRYNTYGANSVATVLGTKWETIDTCAGTLTRVVRGKVRALDLHRHKTVLVSAGHSYLARAQGTATGGNAPATGGNAPATRVNAPAKPLNSGTTSCSDSYSGSGKEVTVPSGAVCTLLAGARVSGNVQVNQGGVFIDEGTAI
jgi:hypothetical protein